jgi:acyl carrier protein
MTHKEAYKAVVSILSRRARVEPSEVKPTSSLVQDLGLDGDDAVDAILEIARYCDTDLSSFNGELYFASEPSLSSIFRPKPEKINLTVGEIVSGVEVGKLGTT